MTVNAEATTKSNVTVAYTGKKVKSASIKSVTATVDGAKTAKKNVTVYLTGKSKVDTVSSTDPKSLHIERAWMKRNQDEKII